MSDNLREVWADIRHEGARSSAEQARDPYAVRLQQASECYRNRQSRLLHPNGTFDKQTRWYPDAWERRKCCDDIRKPTIRWPYSLMVHCRTLGHIACLFEVDIKDLRREIRPAAKAGPKDAWERIRKVG